MSRTAVGGLATVVAIGFVLVVIAGGAGGEEGRPESGSPFSGKVVAVMSNGITSDAAMQDVAVKRLGERYFLVGKGIADDRPENWHQGRIVWFALDDAAVIVEFDDAEQYKRAIREALDEHLAP